MGSVLGAAMVAGLALPVPVLAQVCQRRMAAEVPLRDDDGFITLQARIGGRAASLLVDTGSDGGLMTEAGAARLRLAPDPSHRTLIQGTGGSSRIVRNVRLPELAIGGLGLDGGSVPVGRLPAEPILAPPVAGLLGADLLSRFDVELDLPHRRLVLWSIRMGSVACAPPPAWGGAYDAIPLERHGDRLVLDGRLDGRPIRALVDSGARSRVLSVRAAARLGVDADRLGVDPGGITAGVDLRDATYHWQRFGSLSIGAETQQGPVLTVAPLAEPVDLLLGADWFATRDVWISYATGRLFVRGVSR